MRIWRRLRLSLAGAIAVLAWLVAHQAMAHALASKRVARAPAFARQAAIIGPTDDRAELSRVPGLKDIGFGRDDFRQAMACTGTIVCAVNLRTGTLTAMASAASVVSANQIVTAAHVFFDPKTGQRLASLQSCQFRNYADRRAGIPILVTPAFERQLRENNPYRSGNQGRDWAAVRLRSAIPNCKPYEADASGDWLAPGTELLAISRVHRDIAKKFDGREPIGQRCTVRSAVPNWSGMLPLYFTDCDADTGGSGGLGLVHIGGKWVAKAMMVAIGPSGINYAEYDVTRNQFTAFLGIEQEFLRAVGVERPAPMPIAPIGPGFDPPAVDLDERGTGR